MDALGKLATTNAPDRKDAMRADKVASDMQAERSANRMMGKYETAGSRKRNKKKNQRDVEKTNGKTSNEKIEKG